MQANKRKLIGMLALAPLAPVLAQTTDESWPARPINMVGPYPAGGGPDQIARQLCISVNTVQNHVKSILRKLEARNRTHATTIYGRMAGKNG